MFGHDLMILRHGETEWNLAGRLQGADDSPLTQTGRAQAQRQGEILRAFGVDGFAWVSSPQGRARHTADIAGDVVGEAEIRHDPRLIEIGMGRWTGRHRTDIQASAPHLFDADAGMGWYDHAPDGEGLAALAARTQAFLNDLRGPAVVVTHGITSRVLRCHLQGLEWDAFDRLEGGQGVVFHLSRGVQTKLV